MTTVTVASADKSSSSGAGRSFWKAFLGCARRAHLERLHGMTERAFDAETGERKMKKASWNSKKMVPIIDDAKVGILFHAIREHARKHEDCNCIFEYQDGNEDLEWAEATRLWSYYRVHTVPLGKCQDMEVKFSHGCEGCLKETCTDSKIVVATTPPCVTPFCAKGYECWELCGVPYFTGRIDEVATVDSQEMIDYWVARGAPVDLAIGDLIFLDTKTKKQHESTLVQEYTNSHQFALYMAVAKAQGKKVRGMIADVVFRTADPDMTQFWVPLMDHQVAVAREQMKLGYALRHLFGEDFANATHCQDYFKPCQFLDKQCDRRNEHLSDDYLLKLARL